MENKSPTTYQEQIEILRKRGCEIINESSAIAFLKRVNYYRFTGYLVAYKQPDGMYNDDLTFERVASICVFDHEIRALILKAVGGIEILVKSIIAYHHGHEYGALGYINADNFNEKHDHERFIEKFNGVIQNNINSLFVRHHIKQYGGKFPIWTATELFTMSMTSIFYADLKTTDKKVIATEFNTDYPHLESWLHSASVLRNICAHHNRLYNIRFHQNPKLPRTYINHIGVGVYSLFKQLCVLKLLHSNLRDEWNNAFILPLSALIEKYTNDINVETMGFPNTWEIILRW